MVCFLLIDFEIIMESIMRNNLGFTLIELMIVIAIIGVIAAIAVPAYLNYIARSQVTSVLVELNGARAQYELAVSDNINSAFTIENMGLSSAGSQRCTYIVYEPVAGVSLPALECRLINVVAVLSGESVFLDRQENGTWKCRTSLGIPNKLKPIDCI